jgi:hypothetical protein
LGVTDAVIRASAQSEGGPVKKIHPMKLSRETLRHLDVSAVRSAGAETDATCSNCGICRTDPCCSDACDATAI